MARLPEPDPAYLYAIVDMGSNGIRFSITDLSEATARVFPTVYSHRSAISIFDALQAPKPGGDATAQDTTLTVPDAGQGGGDLSASSAAFSSGSPDDSPAQLGAIPESMIRSIAREFKHFASVCSEFDVPRSNIRVLATDATRRATNSDKFIATIEAAVPGWKVQILSKEDEGRLGAMGIASSFWRVKGLTMDLGGGSTQLGWIYSTADGNIEMPPNGPVSLPLGAAALLQRIQTVLLQGEVATDGLRDEITQELRGAFKQMGVPNDSEITDTLYVSGGGLRGWGYLLMSRHELNPYPISSINGFRVSPKLFHDSAAVEAYAQAKRESASAVFRVSERRLAQVPAVSLLVSCLELAMPDLKQVLFSFGGVREGALFDKLSPEDRVKRPLEVCTRRFACYGVTALTETLRNALPSNECPSTLLELLPAFGNLLLLHQNEGKETRASSALRTTTSGVLARFHGLTHEERAATSIFLSERWGGELREPEQKLLRDLSHVIGAELHWWCKYLGRVAALVGDAWPAGVKSGTEKRLTIRSEMIRVSASGYEKQELQRRPKEHHRNQESINHKTHRGHEHGEDRTRKVIRLHLRFSDEQKVLLSHGSRIRAIEKCGKGRKQGIGYKIEIDAK